MKRGTATKKKRSSDGGNFSSRKRRGPGIGGKKVWEKTSKSKCQPEVKTSEKKCESAKNKHCGEVGNALERKNYFQKIGPLGHN